MRYTQKGFTVIELFIVIIIIVVVLVGFFHTTQYRYIIDKQKFVQCSHNIFTSLENTRNQSLYGKGIGSGTNIRFVNHTEVTLRANTVSGFVVRHFSGATFFEDPSLTVTLPEGCVITSLVCKTLGGASPETQSQMKVFFQNERVSFSGGLCDSNTHKLLEIHTRFKNFTGMILLNAITGVIEKRIPE